MIKYKLRKELLILRIEKLIGRNIFMRNKPIFKSKKYSKFKVVKELREYNKKRMIMIKFV